MAENEVLDVNWGRRWRATRALLRKGGVSSTDLASCACEDAKHDVVRSLKRCLQKGAPLLAILKAAENSSVEMRAAISIFPDQQLARLARDGFLNSETKSPENVARSTAALMFDRFAERTLLFARRNEGRKSEEQRQSIRTELDARRDPWISVVATILEKSLRGEVIKGTRRRRSSERVTAQALVSRSLRPQVTSNGRPR